MDDRRRQKRLRYDSPVYVSLLDESDRVINRLKSAGELSDLSAGGCSFLHRQKFIVGDHLEVRMLLNESLAKKYNQKELTVRGNIVRISRKGDSFLISVRFIIDR